MQPAILKHRHALAPAWRDIAIALAVAFASGWLSARFELHELLFAWSRRWERIQLDEWPVAVLAFSICLLLLYAVRHRQLRLALSDNRRLARRRSRPRKTNAGAWPASCTTSWVNTSTPFSWMHRRSSPPVPMRRSSKPPGRISDNATHVYGVVSDLVRRLRPAALDELGPGCGP